MSFEASTFSAGMEFCWGVFFPHKFRCEELISRPRRRLVGILEGMNIGYTQVGVFLVFVRMQFLYWP